LAAADGVAVAAVVVAAAVLAAAAVPATRPEHGGRAPFRQLKTANRQRFTLRLYTGHAKVVKTATISVREP
jgi:hypothetical protein